MPHMDDGHLQAWLDGTRSGVPEAERSEMGAHLASCDACASRLEELRATDSASRELLAALGAADPAVPDFSEVVARSQALDDGSESTTDAAPEATAYAPPEAEPASDTPQARTPRRFPVQWAASIVLALGVGWVANEVTQSRPSLVAPPTQSFPAASPAPVVSEDVATSNEGEDALNPEYGLDAATAEPQAAEQVAPDAQDRAASDPRPTSLTGRVVDSQTGRPLREVVLQIPGTELSALTNSEGRFRMQLSDDSLAGDATVQATMIGYGVASRPVPTGSGELSVGDLQMDQRAVQLEGVVVTGTAIAAERREVAGPATLPIPEDATWERVSTSYASAVLGTPVLKLPGLRWTRIGFTNVQGSEVVRVTHETAAGDAVVLYLGRSPLELATSPDITLVRRTRTDQLYMVAVGPIPSEALTDLLLRAEPMG